MFAFSPLYCFDFATKKKKLKLKMMEMMTPMKNKQYPPSDTFHKRITTSHSRHSADIHRHTAGSYGSPIFGPLASQRIKFHYLSQVPHPSILFKTHPELLFSDSTNFQETFLLIYFSSEVVLCFA